MNEPSWRRLLGQIRDGFVVPISGSRLLVDVDGTSSLQAKVAQQLMSAYGQTIDEPLPPAYQRDYAPSVTQVRAQLGEEVYASAWSEGHAMSPEQAIALALEE